MKLLGLLRRVEWIESESEYFCPECCEQRPGPHRTFCDLKAAIDQLEVQEKEAVRAALEILGEK